MSRAGRDEIFRGINATYNKLLYIQLRTNLKIDSTIHQRLLTYIGPNPQVRQYSTLGLFVFPPVQWGLLTCIFEFRAATCLERYITT